MNTDEKIADLKVKIRALRKLKKAERGLTRAKREYKVKNLGKSKLAPYIHLIGNMSDAEIADMAGVSHERVRQVREYMGASKFVDSHEEEVFYALKHGREATLDKFGCCWASVVGWAKKLGYVIPKRTKREAIEKDPDLGVLTDAEVGARHNTSHMYVYLVRKKLGIAPQQEKVGNHRKTPDIVWTPERESVLGTMTDADAAAISGVSRELCYRRRRALGIKAFNRHA